MCYSLGIKVGSYNNKINLNCLKTSCKQIHQTMYLMMISYIFQILLSRLHGHIKLCIILQTLNILGNVQKKVAILITRLCVDRTII